MRALLIAAVLAVAVLAAPAAAQDERLEAAREEAGTLPTPVSQLQTPVGRLQLERAELLAARFNQPIRFTLTLDRAVERGALRIGVPRRWRDVPSSGLRPSTARDAVEFDLDGAVAGDELTAELRDRGIPAGTYELPVSLDGRRVGRLELVLYAPVREAETSPWASVRALNVSDGPFDQSETFVTVVPGNPERLIAGANGGAFGFSAWISDDGGDSWVERPLPTDDAHVSGTLGLDPCCDPMSAADANGNLWYGGLDDVPDSHIVVSRVPAGSDDFAVAVALPSRTPSAVQDKPMMTIDNSPSSPTFGRLYVVWSEPFGGGSRIVASFCDTRPTVAACDLASSWSPVTSITTQAGSSIYADVAVGADGKVFVTWWNYSAANRIEGSTCAGNCGASASWSAPAGIAALDATGGQPVPFDCPILAQPGGRASTAPNVEVSRTDGRVYVAWSDLRAGSGTTRCGDKNPPLPLATHLRFDALVKSAAGALPVTATPATRLLADAEGAPGSDDWFPWLAVDQTTGIAYAAFYSTREDTTRRTAHFYARSVGADGTLGQLVRASDVPSDYSDATCCQFGNDYGDYAGLDVTDGVAYPIWSDRSTASGEAVAERITLPPPGDAPLLRPAAAGVDDPAPGGDADGVPEPGETLRVAIPVANAGSATATGTQGTLSSPSPEVGFPAATTDYGDVAPGVATGGSPYRVALAAGLGCGATVPLRLRVQHDDGFAVARYGVQTGGAVATVASADVPRAVPDTAPGSVTSTLTMPDAGRIGDVDVGVSITHAFVGDVSVVLQHPDETAVVLTQRTGNKNNSGDNFTSTVFDDEAAGALFAATAPFTGRFRPDDPLSAFDGKPWAGKWTLTVIDSVAPDAGILTGWSLQRRTCGEPLPQDPPQGGGGPAVTPPVLTEPTPAGPPPPVVNPAAPFIRLATPGARLRARSGRVKIGLRGCRGCRGRLALTARVKGKRVRIGRASFTVATSGKVTVTVKLSARGKALLRRVKRIPLAAALSVTATDGRTARGSGRLTIRK